MSFLFEYCSQQRVESLLAEVDLQFSICDFLSPRELLHRSAMLVIESVLCSVERAVEFYTQCTGLLAIADLLARYIADFADMFVLEYVVVRYAHPIVCLHSLEDIVGNVLS